MGIFTRHRRWLPLWLLSGAALAAGPQQAVQHAAGQWLAQQIAQAGLRDASYQLQLTPPRHVPPCQGQAEASVLEGEQLSRLRLLLRCDGQSAVYSVRVTLESAQAVAARDLPAGSVLQESDLLWQRASAGSLAQAADAANVVGMASRSSVRAGQKLSRRQLQAPQLVRRGMAVNIVARSDGVEVSMAGEALDGGALGERIRVRNHSSGRILDATVSAGGEVSL